MKYEYITLEFAKQFYIKAVILLKVTDIFKPKEDIFFKHLAKETLKIINTHLENKEIFSDDIFKLELQHAVNVVCKQNDIIKKYGICPFKEHWVLRFYKILEEIYLEDIKN